MKKYTGINAYALEWTDQICQCMLRRHCSMHDAITYLNSQIIELTDDDIIGPIENSGSL